jgi:RNA polymerase sigma-70 factor (ECF subfamily)
MVEQARLVSGDAEVYARVAPELMVFATGLVGANDAADVVSGAVVRVLSSPAWASVSNRRAYLYRAVYNEALTWTQRSSRRRAVERRVAATVETWELPTFRPEVRAAVERLSVQQRAVVLLTYWADLDPSTVADRLGISDGAVRRHLARARHKLRKVLDD